MTVRRFEQIGKKPARYWHVEQVGAEVRVTSGIVGKEATNHVEQLASVDAAAAWIEEQVVARRAEGFFEIKRVASAEQSVHRKEMSEWVEGERRRFVTLEQKDKLVVWTERFAGEDVSQRPRSVESSTIAAASQLYDQWAGEIKELSETVEDRLAAAARQLAAQKTSAQDPLNPALEAQCWAAPDDPVPWGVLADWLIEQDQPAGELSRNRDRPLDLPRSEDYDIDCKWRHGFVQAIEFDRTYKAEHHTLAKVVESCLSSDLMRWVDTVELGVEHDIDNNYHDAVAAIVESPIARTLRTLRLDVADASISTGNSECYGHDIDHRGCLGYGDLSELIAKLPALEELSIKCGGECGSLGDAHLPKLTSLIVESMGMGDDDLRALYKLDAPELDHFRIGTGDEDYGCTVQLADLKPLLACKHFPKLAHLGIIESNLGAPLVTAIAKSKLLPKLHCLDLSGGVLRGRDAVRAFVANAERFAHLETIDLSRNLLTDPQAEAIAAALPNVTLDDQRVPLGARNLRVALYEPPEPDDEQAEDDDEHYDDETEE